MLDASSVHSLAQQREWLVIQIRILRAGLAYYRRRERLAGRNRVKAKWRGFQIITSNTIDSMTDQLKIAEHELLRSWE